VVKAQEVEHLTAEVTHLKGQLDSKVDGNRKKTAERIQNLEEENFALKLELEKNKAAEEKTVRLERMIDELKSDVDDARNLGSKSKQLADEWQKKAMEGLASALQEMSAESREVQEKYLLKQDEIGHAQAQVEELNLSLKNIKENYELLLDEANYEKVCLTKADERLEAEAKRAHEEWQSKELSFVNSIKNSEEEIVAVCHTRVSGHQDPGANIITRCAGTKSHAYDESWHRIECHNFTI
jgi:chromosome segregation ATPase